MQQAATTLGCLDFRSPVTPAGGLYFDRFEGVIEARYPEQVPDVFARLERAVAAGSHAFGFVSYEAASAFDRALLTHAAPRPPLPLAWFGLHRHPQPGPAPAAATSFAYGPWQPLWNRLAYEEAFARVKEHLRNGATYQLNLTFPLRTSFTGDVAAAYHRLCAAQGGAYSGLIVTPDWAVASASPELFFELRGRDITVRPMKGTRRRAPTNALDQALASALRANPKDQAENVMIVDLLRNDLGRLAVSGSVTVPTLFAVEKYPTVWQMTSTVTARVRRELGLFDIFKALFPCGSVTGAPKVKTMGIIAQEEPAPRGVYCGALGYVAPGGDAVFNVAIRTLTVVGAEAEFPVGSGVVADSTAGEEYDECLLKARVLTRGTVPVFQLLATILWQPVGGFFLLARHLDRLLDSATYFDFQLDPVRVRKALSQASAGWTQPQRVRLLVSPAGVPTVEAAPLAGAASPIRTVRVASTACDSSNPFLHHKTTYRHVYDRARSGRGEADDVLLFNERGELTESTIANLALRLDGVWYTPPVACGLLAGVMRAQLLADGELHERVLTLDDLHRATGMRLLNSLRGVFDVKLIL